IAVVSRYPHPDGMMLTWDGNNYALDAVLPSLLLLNAAGIQGEVWNGPAWSIGAEFYVYLLFALVLLTAPRRLVPVSLGLSLSALALVYWLAPDLMNTTWDYGMVRCAAGFFAGVAAYHGHERLRRADLKRATYYELGAIVFVVLFVIAAGNGPDNVSLLSLAAPLVFGLAVIVFAGEGGILSLILRTRPFAALGRYSFSIYMIHQPLLILLTYGVWLRGLPPDSAWAAYRPVASPDLLMIDFVLAVILIAAASYCFVERPARDRLNALAPRAAAGLAVFGGVFKGSLPRGALAWSANRLGVTDDALDLRRAQLQRALQRVDRLMHGADRELRLDAAVEIHDFAVLGLAHAHVVHVADDAALRRQFAQRNFDGRDALRRRFASGDILRLQRLDMRLDLDMRAELGLDRAFQRVSHVVCGAQRQSAVDLEVERDREPVVQVVHHHVMHGEGAVARDHHHAVEYGFVVERDGMRGHDRLGAGHLAAQRRADRVLDRVDAVERQRAADRHRKVDEGGLADGARPHLVDADDARHLGRGRRDERRGAGRGGVGQGIDGALAEPPAGDADQHRDDQSCGGVGPRVTEIDADEAAQYRQRRPQVGREVQRVGLERVALRRVRDPRQRARAEKVDGDRYDDDAEGPGGGRDGVAFVFHQPLERFPDDDTGEQEQERRLGQCRDCLDLAVAVMVLLVGRPAGDAHGD